MSKIFYWPNWDHEKLPPLHRADNRAQVRRALNFVGRCGLDGMEVDHKRLSHYLGNQRLHLGKWLRYHLLEIKRDYYNGKDGTSLIRILVLRPEGRKYVRDVLKQHTPPEERALMKTPHTGEGAGPGIVCKSDEHISSPIKNPDEGLLILCASPSPDLHTIPAPSLPPVCVSQLVVAGWISKRDARMVASDLSSLNFTYREKSGRLLHPLQSVREDWFDRVMAEADLRWDYDISSCQPTVLYEACIQAGGSPVLLHPIRDFLTNKDVYLDAVQAALGIDRGAAKALLTALFFNSTISRSPKCRAYAEHGEPVITLARTPLIRNLIRSIQTGLWGYMRRKTGHRLLKARSKAALATGLERRCLDAVHAHLLSINEPHFLIHDGWRTRHEIDTAHLTNIIREATTFNVTIKKELR